VESLFNRPVGEVGIRPKGDISESSGGTRPSNHDATAKNLLDRGVNYKATTLQAAPQLQACHDAFWAALSVAGGDERKKISPKKGDYSGLVAAVEKSYESGQRTNQGETAFEIELFEALNSYLGNTVAGRETIVVSGKSQLSIIVLKGHWNVDQVTYALGFSRQVTSEALGIPDNFGCAKRPRHDHSCVLLSKRGKQRTFRVMETSATVELKTIKQTCMLETRKNAAIARHPKLLDTDGALSQVVAYTLSDVWTCLARQGMTTDRKNTPNRVRFGLLACKVHPKLTGQEKSDDTAETDDTNTSKPSVKKQKTTPDPTQWALGDVEVPEACGGAFFYEVNSFGSFKSSNGSEATAAYLSVLTQGLKLVTSLERRTQLYHIRYLESSLCLEGSSWKPNR